MSRAGMVLGLVGMDEKSYPKQINSTVRGLQKAMSKIDPKVLRSVFASPEGSVMEYSPEVVAATAGTENMAAPYFIRSWRSPVLTDKQNETVPLTVFYKSTVAVFNLSREKAEDIIKLAETAKTEGKSVNEGVEEELSFDTPIPIARRQSLMRFLEKRRDRLVSLSPYDYGSSNRNDGKSAKLIQLKDNGKQLGN